MLGQWLVGGELILCVIFDVFYEMGGLDVYDFVYCVRAFDVLLEEVICVLGDELV